eukprot:CAMPEP_0172870862 /NCGR_PEP_ID=MMETSP1075-20121228/91759_1 /TAXON_ID=2916 /ORGANISM="Ceratium fusus, Strain PA161109" /LENGTH=69 /DNA_ID=CAMNT_0013721035 /DNA_START=1 /DNA_END=210 /DNA_ORIENTATION=+
MRGTSLMTSWMRGVTAGATCGAEYTTGCGSTICGAEYTGGAVIIEAACTCGITCGTGTSTIFGTSVTFS